MAEAPMNDTVLCPQKVLQRFHSRVQSLPTVAIAISSSVRTVWSVVETTYQPITNGRRPNGYARRIRRKITDQILLSLKSGDILPWRRPGDIAQQWLSDQRFVKAAVQRGERAVAKACRHDAWLQE